MGYTNQSFYSPVATVHCILHRAPPGSSNPLRDSTYRRQINLEYTVDEVEGEKRKMKFFVKMTVLEERIYSYCTSENILRPYSFWAKRKRQIPKWLICANVLLHRIVHSRNGWFWPWLLWICIRLDPELFAAKKKELINNYSFLFFSFNWTKIQMDCFFINDVSWLILSFDRL